MKKILAEFKTFVLRGNVLDLAVGVIIGGAFQKIVNSLVNDMIMPVITLITGGVDFTSHFLALDGGQYADLAAAQAAGTPVLCYGAFITQVINFLLMAAVIFALVKGMNTLAARTLKRKEKEAAVTQKTCPYCLSKIPLKATRCPCCTSHLEE